MAKKTSAVDPKDLIKKTVSAKKQEALEKDALIADPKKEAKKAEKARSQKSAEDAMNSEFFSEVVKQQYRDLVQQIEDKKVELKALTGIEVEADDLASFIGARNLAVAELDQKAQEAKDQRDSELNAKIKEFNEKTKELQDSYAKTRKELEENEKVYRNELQVARNREAAEFEYNLKRTRSIENDAWEDEKAKREKELSDREAEVASRLEAVQKREAKMDELETSVNNIPNLIEEATQKGKEAGKKDADTSHAFEKRYMEKEHENKVSLLENTVKSQEDTINTLKDQVASLQSKLDTAYQRNQEMSIAVAQNSGKTTVVTGDSSVSKK